MTSDQLIYLSCGHKIGSAKRVQKGQKAKCPTCGPVYVVKIKTAS